MASNQTRFDTFHLLPEEDPANIVEISSDEGEIDQSNIPFQQEVDRSPKDTEPSPDATAASTSFRKTMSMSIPVHLVEPQVMKILRAAAVELLELAVRDGVSLNSVYIDNDCLPMWPGRMWDPKEQSLHENLQLRLKEHQNAMQIDARVKAEIVQRGNERLNKAVGRGLQLKDLTIGEDLLPTWPILNDWVDNTASDDGDTVIDVGSGVNTDDIPPPSEGYEAEEEAGAVVAGNQKLRSAWSSDTDVDEAESALVSDSDDEALMFGLLSQHGVAEEDDENAPLSNVVHGVEVVGSDMPGCDHADFEVYLAHNDSEVEELPEAELAIDEEALERDHHLADMVEIELVGREIRWRDPRQEGGAGSVDSLAVPDCTMDSTEDEGPNEPVTPSSEDGERALAGWVDI